MKAIRLFVFLAILSLFTGITANAQNPTPSQPQDQGQEQLAKAPLPDVSKAPYVKAESGAYYSIFHSDWGILKGDLYVDNNEDPQNLIMVFSNEDGSKKYAEWMEFDAPASKATKRWIRGYNYKDGKWVFEKGVFQEK